MKFSSISDEFFKLCYFDRELMHNKDEKRPYLIIVKLKYNGHKQDFAIPFRSNISNYIPKDQYFSLPPRFSTNKNKIHGLHYLKMFPVNKQYLEKYNIENDKYFQMVYNIIIKNKKIIIQEAQDYLDKYQLGTVYKYSTNIYSIYNTLYNTALSEVAVTKINDD